MLINDYELKGIKAMNEFERYCKDEGIDCHFFRSELNRSGILRNHPGKNRSPAKLFRSENTCNVLK